MRTIEWDDTRRLIRIIDQRRLPSQLEFIDISTYREAGEAIINMAVRGAPAIGVVAAYGIALAAEKSGAQNIAVLNADVEKAAGFLANTRPTAVNLNWAIDRMLKIAHSGIENAVDYKAALIKAAHFMADEDVAINHKIANIGASLIHDGDTIIHHCNTGALATVDWGTALGVIRKAHEQGKRVHVLVDETRPRLQGSRLTAWELNQYGIPYDIICDSASGYYMNKGKVNLVLFGGDRVARNGDVANKVGSYMLALAAHENNVPVYSVVPTSTIDLSLQSGDLIPIEERDPKEVLEIQYQGENVSPEKANALNPAFDVTPSRLLSGLITERGIIKAPIGKNLGKLLKN